MRALATAAGLAGAIAVAGLAAWLLTDPATASSPSSAPSGAETAGGQGQRAFIDPATGQLRPMEHEDVAALEAASASSGARRLARTASTESQVVDLPDGSVVATVPEELHTFSVATRTPDGRIVFEHATGPTQADALARARAANAKTKTQGQGKEARDDR